MEQLPKSALQLIGVMTRPYRSRLVIFFVLTFLGIVASTALPFAVRGVIDELVKSSVASRAAWLYVGLFILLGLCDEWFWRFAENVMRKYNPPMVERIRSLLFDYTHRKKYSFFVNSSSGQLGHWINQTVNTLANVVDSTIWGVWPQTIGLILAAVFLFIANWILALIFLVWLIALLSFTVMRGRKYGQLVEAESDAISVASGHVVDSFSNHLSVRVFNSRERESRLLGKKQDDIINKWGISWRYSFFTNMVKGNSAVVASSVGMIAILMLFNRHSITIGDVALFIAYFTAASRTIWDLSWQLDNYYKNFGTINNALSGLRKGELERVSRDEATFSSSKITLKNLEFHYPDQPEKHILVDINLTISSGERVGLVGHSGAGKTTFVGLLLGFYEPTAGSILFDGIESRQIAPDILREQIAFVPQDTNLFNRTVSENISYARPDATPEEIHQAAKDAQALEFIEKLPNGFDSMIGERGVKLSGGQRQRIAIARALLKNSPILLLDEATSALDSVSEQAIQRAFVAAMKGRTAIVIAHRLSTLRHLDRMVVFDQGKIVETGTHDELVEANGIYADLWRRQKDGFIAE